MLALIGIAAVAFGVGLSGALSPGPLTVLTIREAARRGWRAGPLATAGHAVIEGALVLLLALGLSASVRDHGTATALIGLGGGGVLVWMAWGLLRLLPAASLPRRVLAAAGPVAVASPPRAGTAFAALRAVAPVTALVSVANPYWVIWWASVGTKLTVDSLSAGWAGPAAVFLGHILSDLLWLTFVAFVVGSGARWMSDRTYRGLLGACVLFLLVLGVVFAVNGARSLT